ncbi:MAG: hypothetical protein ABSB74_01725 [Tepidisphaeraceae bacterium]
MKLDVDPVGQIRLPREEPEIHRRSFISSTSATGGAIRQPMQNSMNSATSILHAPHQHRSCPLRTYSHPLPGGSGVGESSYAGTRTISDSHHPVFSQDSYLGKSVWAIASCHFQASPLGCDVFRACPGLRQYDRFSTPKGTGEP